MGRFSVSRDEVSELVRRRRLLTLLAALLTVIGVLSILAALFVLFGGWWALLAAGVALTYIGLWVVPA